MNSSHLIQKWESHFSNVDSERKRMMSRSSFPMMKSALTMLFGLILASVFLLNSCNGASVNGDESCPPKLLLRYVVPIEDRDIYLDEVVRQCRSMGIEEVLQFTMLSNGEYGGDAFYDGEEFEKRMEHFCYYAERIRHEGLILSIN
jgi:hypothetical protein